MKTKHLTIVLLALILPSCATKPLTYEEKRAAKAKQALETKQWLANYYKEKRKDPDWVEFERRLARSMAMRKKYGITESTYFPQVPPSRNYYPSYRYSY